MSTWLPPAFTAPCRKPQADASDTRNGCAGQVSGQRRVDLATRAGSGRAEITAVFTDWSVWSNLMRIDLNADVGEYASATDPGDAALLPHVTSANVACGFHAGSPATMRATVELGSRLGVAIGAHPGFFDVEGFGRREMHLAGREVEDLVLYQIGALAALASTCGVHLQHVKPHGALYNMASRDELVAAAVARAVKAFDASLILVGQAGSAMVAAAESTGLRVAGEAFADRAYGADGMLVPRNVAGAVLRDRQAVVEQALRLVCEGKVVALTGELLQLRVDTLCIHGDTPGAPELARDVSDALVKAGATVRALGSL